MTSPTDPVVEVLHRTRDALFRAPPDGVSKREMRVWWDANVARLAREIQEKVRPGEPLRVTYDALAKPKPSQRKVTSTNLEWLRSRDSALSMLHTAEAIFEEPETAWAWHDWTQGGLGEQQTEWRLGDLVGVPSKFPSIGDVSDDMRDDIAAFTIRLVGQIRGEWDIDGRFGAISEAVDGMKVARWAAEAVLCDALTGEHRLGLTAVDVPTVERFIATHHSHLPAINRRGLLYALGIKRGERLVCVGTVNTPTGRWKQPERVVELTRVASDSTSRGAASMLVSRVIDSLRLVSPRGDVTEPPVLVTYSLSGEQAAVYRSLRDKGLRPVRKVRGKAPSGARAGSDVSLARVDKVRWEAGPGAGKADWSLVAA